MKQFLQNRLASTSRKILGTHRPVVVAVTGSIGKSSAKEAVFAVLSGKYRARTNVRNYNNELGLPLTVIGVEAPGRNIFKWLRVFWKGFTAQNSRQVYPEALVLELGIDRPGDMDRLMEIVNPNVAVLTTVGISHLEYFENEQQILTEKAKVFKHFGEGNVAVLNLDDANVASLIPKFPHKFITYGTGERADVRIVDWKTARESGVYGVVFHLSHGDESHSVWLPNVVGAPHVYACAAGVAAGIALGIPFGDAVKSVQNYHAQQSRLTLISGVHGSVLIDDTYNAAPVSTLAALRELAQFPVAQKVAVLGDMLELGSLSDASHVQVGRHVADLLPNAYFIAVGQRMQLAVDEAIRNRFPRDRIFHFAASVQAAAKAKELAEPGTAILVKGSQGTRTEKIVVALMEHPETAPELVCRQYGKWLKG
jgi:UDP-N-acetylmuramoyl-tripeptide--D-alanyl-D-alanine ligase